MTVLSSGLSYPRELSRRAGAMLNYMNDTPNPLNAYPAWNGRRSSWSAKERQGS